MKKKILIGVGVIIMLFLLTNPSSSDFKTYIVGKYNLKILPNDLLRDENNYVTFGRTSNFLLFSVYTRNYTLIKHSNPPSIIKKDTLVDLNSLLDEQVFKINDQTVAIPSVNVESFLKKYPKAQEVKSFIVEREGKVDTADVPIDRISDFTKKYPDAKPLPILIKIMKLYSNLVNDQYKLGSFDNFVKNLQDSVKRKRFYDNLTSDGYKLGNYTKFTSMVKKNLLFTIKVDTVHFEPIVITIDTSQRYIGIFKNFF